MRALKILGGVIAALILLLIIVYWLFIDSIIKWQIESQGSQQVQARVELDSVNFRLYPTAITLKGLQVTNPSEPMRNLVQAGQIDASLDWSDILQRRVIADEIIVSELAFNRERASSGAIPGLTPPPPEPADYGLAGQLPGMSLPDVTTLIGAEKERLQAELRENRQALQAMEQRWRERLDELTDDDTLQAYRERADALRRASPVERLAGYNQLRQDVQRELRQYDRARDELRSDLAQARQQMDAARNLPQRELQQAMARLGLQDLSTDSLVKVLFGSTIADLLNQGFAWYQQMQATPDTPAAPEEPEWLILVRKARVDGAIEFGEQSLRFDGQAENLTHQQAHWDLPITFALQGLANQTGEFLARGSIDHRNPDQPRDLIEFALGQLPLSGLTLTDQPELNVTLARAVADISGHLGLEGGKLDAQLLGQFSQALLETAVSGDNAIARAVAEVLSTVRDFGIDLGLSGDVSNPRLQVRSDLDQLLSRAVGSQLQEQAAALQSRLQSELQSSLGPELDALQAQAGQLQGLEGLLGNREQQLQELLRRL